MKNIIFNSFIITAICLLLSIKAFAVKADPVPFTVKQPDGSTLTLQMHGDEFLGWMTCNGALVSKGSDGYYYYASFNADGSILRGTNKVSQMSSAFAGSLTGVKPPKSAYIRAAQLRKEMFGKDVIRQNGSSGSISIGSHKFVVLLISFNDLAFTVPDPNRAFTNLLNQKGYADNSATGSAKDYYEENSKSNFLPDFDVYGPITVSHGYEYYSKNKGFDTPGARDLLKEACQIADAEIDFSQYDADGDGVIDNVFFYFAGHNMAEGASGHIWPHKWYVGGAPSFDGKVLAKYACTSEYKGSSGETMCGIGTFCHEFGHVIGLPDFYDTNEDDNGYANGLWRFSLMSSGNYNNGGKTPPYLNSTERNILGWMDMPEVLTSSGDYTLETVNNNKAFMTKTSNPGEYFVYENRQLKGWDAYLPNHGMLIFHVDKSLNAVNGKTAASRWASGDGLNEVLEHQCMDLVEAVYPESSITSSAQIPFPGSNNVTSFTSSTRPGAIAWDGNATGYNIKNISETSGNVSFSLVVDTNSYLNGTVTSSDNTPVQGATISLTYSSGLDAISSASGLRLSAARSSMEEYSAKTDASGSYKITVPKDGVYNISVSCNGYNSYSGTISLQSPLSFNKNITLSYIDESNFEQLQKYHGIASNRIGDGTSTTAKLYASVRYTASELKSSVGKTIKDIMFAFTCTSTVEEVQVLVYFDNVLAFSQKVSNPVIGSLNTVDISNSNIIIPANKEVRIAYLIKNCDYGYPILCDVGPNITGGLEISYDGATWTDAAKEYGLDYNAVIGFSIYNKADMFYQMGYSYIQVPSSGFVAGSSYSLSIVQGNNEVKSVVWYCDEKEIAATAAVFTSGSHSLKAVITYKDESKEIVSQEIKVQ